jgi:polyisoprenoid-binding protein YceI
MKKIFALAIAASLSSIAFAAPETYMIEGTHTLPRFEYNHLGYSMQLSRFDKTTGTITLDRVAKTGTVDVEIDAKSVNTGYALFNEHIQGEELFDTAKYPTITYKSSKVNFKGNEVVSVEGNLTVKGVTKSVTLTVNSFNCKPHPMVKKDACGATATAKIKRSDFNVSKAIPYVSDEVTLTIPVEAIKQ